jgi:hypothetical protein
VSRLGLAFCTRARVHGDGHRRGPPVRVVGGYGGVEASRSVRPGADVLRSPLAAPFRGEAAVGHSESPAKPSPPVEMRKHSGNII